MLRWLKRLPLRLAARAAGLSTKIMSVEQLFDGIMAGITGHKLHDFESYLRVASRHLWATWKSCDITAKIILDTPIKTINKAGDEVENRDIVKLFAEPNPFWSMKEMIYQWTFHMKLTGNAYWLKDQANLAGDRPRALFPLNPSRMTLVLSRDTGKTVVGYQYVSNTGVIGLFDANEIIHFRIPHPNDEWLGLGEAEAGEDLLNEFLSRQSWNKNFWERGASPSGVMFLKSPNTMYADEEKWKKKKAEFDKEFGGTKNAGKTIWLNGEWDYKQLGLTKVDMEHLDSDKWSIEQIFHLHGIPLSIAGIKEADSEASARVDELIVRRYTIKPLVGLLTDTLQTDLINGFDRNLILKAELTGLVDVQAIADFIAPWFDRGCFTPNEVRKMLGHEETDEPAHDLYYISSALTPLELAGLTEPANAQQQAQSLAQAFNARVLGLNGRR